MKYRFVGVLEYLVVAFVLLTSVATVAINISDWESLMGGVDRSHALYYCYGPPFTPQYFMFIYVLLVNVRNVVVLGVLLTLVVMSSLFVVERNTSDFGVGRVFIFVFPSLVLLLADPAILPTVFMLISIVLFISRRYGAGSLFYGVAVAMNWFYILFLPTMVVLSERQYRSLILILIPPIVLFYLVHYYVYIIVVSFLMFGARNPGYVMFMENTLNTYRLFFPEDGFIFLVITAILGFVAGYMASDARGVDRDKAYIFTLLSQMMLLEFLLGDLQSIAFISIHIPLIMLAMLSGIPVPIMLLVDVAFVLGQNMGIWGIIAYKILLLVAFYFLILIFLGEEKTPRSRLLFSIRSEVARKYVASSLNTLSRIMGSLKRLWSKVKYLRERVTLRCLKYVALYVSALLLLFLRVYLPRHIVFDEAHYVNAARTIIKHHYDPRPEHPPLVKYMIAIGILLLGDNSLGWRVPIIVVSALAIPSTYYIASKISGSERIAIIATTLLMFDPLFYELSRLAMLDGPALGLTTLAVAILMKYMLDKKHNIRWLYLSGLVFGLALSCKVQAIVPIFVALLLVPVPAVRHKTIHLASSLVLLPVATLFMSYLPLYLLSMVGGLPSSIVARMLVIQILLRIMFPLWVLLIVNFMFTVYSRLPATQPQIESHPWDWLLGWKPIRGYCAFGGALYMVVILLGNPVTWMFGLILLIVLNAVYAVIWLVAWISRRFEIGGGFIGRLKGVENFLLPILYPLLWGILIWLAYMPSALAHWFYWYYKPGTNVFLDEVREIVWLLFKEGRPSYIFYMHHILPPMYIVMAYILDKLDKTFEAPLSIFLVVSSVVYFIAIYPVVSGAVWIHL